MDQGVILQTSYLSRSSGMLAKATFCFHSLNRVVFSLSVWFVISSLTVGDSFSQQSFLNSRLSRVLLTSVYIFIADFFLGRVAELDMIHSMILLIYDLFAFFDVYL